MLASSPAIPIGFSSMTHVEDLPAHKFDPVSGDFGVLATAPNRPSVCTLSVTPTKRKRGRPRKSPLCKFSQTKLKKRHSTASLSALSSSCANHCDFSLELSENRGPLTLSSQRFSHPPKSTKLETISQPLRSREFGLTLGTGQETPRGHTSVSSMKSMTPGILSPLPAHLEVQLHNPPPKLDSLFKCTPFVHTSQTAATDGLFSKSSSASVLPFSFHGRSPFHGLPWIGDSPIGQTLYPDPLAGRPDLHETYLAPAMMFGLPTRFEDPYSSSICAPPDGNLIGRLLPQATAALYAARTAGLSGPHAWSPKMVAAFIATLPGCHSVSKKFIENEIDGAALLCLEQGDLMTVLNLKLGPAVKVFGAIKALRTSLLSIPLSELSSDHAKALMVAANCFSSLDTNHTAERIASFLPTSTADRLTHPSSLLGG